MTESEAARTPPTYGNWRRPSSPGLGRLGLTGTLVLLVGLVVVIVTMALSLVWAAGVGAGLGVVLLPFVARNAHGRNGFEAVGSRLAWYRGRLQGAVHYRSGPLSPNPTGRFSLPGLAASIDALVAHDGYGRPFGLLSHPHTGHVTAVLQCAPEGAALVDPDQIDQWVANWGEWLNGLGKEPGLAAASVTVESAPDPGTRLARQVRSRVRPDAPALARRVLDEIVDAYPAGSSAVTCRVALTWSCAPRLGGRRRSVEEMAVEVGRSLPALAAGLQGTGAGPARPMTRGELAAAVRVAFDPDAQLLIEQAGPDACDWADAGPVSTTERIDTYFHEAAASVSWTMTLAPRGAVHSNVLNALLAPHPDVARKRVTLFYRPYEPARATTIVERDRKDTLFRANSSKVARARDLAEVAAANKTAEEDAHGAGLVRFALGVTATVKGCDDNALALARSAVDSLAVVSRLSLRPAFRCQATTFLACLPLGLIVQEHLRISSTIREAL